jgi:hypothetical protein
MWRRDTSFETAQAMARGRAEALLNRDASNVKITLTFGTYLSDSLQPGLGPDDPTSHSASHSGPGPLADTMIRVPHGSWRLGDDAARVVWFSLMSTEVSLRPPCMPLSSQPTIPADFRRQSRLCVPTPCTLLPSQRAFRVSALSPGSARHPSRIFSDSPSPESAHLPSQ